MPDFSKMTYSALLRFAEEQSWQEAESLIPEVDPDRGASWASTLAIVQAMEEREAYPLLCRTRACVRHAPASWS